MSRVMVFAAAVLLLVLAFGADAAAPTLPIGAGCNQWQCQVDAVFTWCWESDACVLAWGIAI